MMLRRLFYHLPARALTTRRPCLDKATGVIAISLLASCATSPVPPRTTAAAVSSPVIEPEFLADPIEPLNRGVFALNRGLLEGVVNPAGRVYRMIVPKPVRNSIGHFSHNILYPGRVVNQALQGRWQDAGDDSLRFLTNTTAGVGGFFDVATRWDIPRPRADFGQTFQHWGWKPTSYVMLPLFGPSDETNALGTIADEATEPWNYVGPYRRISYGTTFNRITETSGETVRMIRSEADPYSASRLAWTYMSKHGQPDWSVRGPRDASTLQTLAVASIRLKDPDFPGKSRGGSVRIAATGRSLPFEFWPQQTAAPLVFITPGLGSHRLSATTLSVAEALYQNGFSVVAATCEIHPEFMERASTAALPGHPPTDCGDLLAALSEINRHLESKHPGRFTRRALVGCSMGGFQALYLAARENKAPAGSVRFDRYIGINSPVDLHHGIGCIDRFHDAPLAWPAGERQSRVNNAVHKVGGLTALPPSALASPPFDALESQYLIGLTFRYTLRDVIFSSESRHPSGVLQTPVSKWRREPFYDEILDFSYRDYVTRLLFPHFRTKGISTADFKHHGTLRHFATDIGRSRKAAVITNRNDFLLAADDLTWLRSTLGPSKVTVFADGGHLGNLASPQVQGALAGFLADLK